MEKEADSSKGGNERSVLPGWQVAGYRKPNLPRATRCGDVVGYPEVEQDAYHPVRGRLFSLAFSPSGRALATGLGNGTAQMYNILTE